MTKSPKDKEATASLSEDLRSKINPGDVVAGRGEIWKRINAHYRALTRKLSPVYHASRNNSDKHRVAHLVIKEITDNGGRFLNEKGEPLDDYTTFRKVMAALKDTPRSSKKMRENKIKKTPPVAKTSRPLPPIPRVISKDPVHVPMRKDSVSKEEGLDTDALIKDHGNSTSPRTGWPEETNVGNLAAGNNASVLMNIVSATKEKVIKDLKSLHDAAEKDIAPIATAALALGSYHVDIVWLAKEHSDVLQWLDGGGIFNMPLDEINNFSNS